MSDSPTAPFDAVIWDFGGVITASPFEAFARLERERGLPTDFLRSVNATNHLENAWAKLERGTCSLEEFDHLFAAESRALGFEVRGADMIALLEGAIRPAMVEALRRIAARMKTGLITNNFTADTSAGRAAAERSEILSLFDQVIESARAGIRKPDPRIYSMMTDALGVAPGRCVYLDDLGINLKPARALGMTTIKVVDPDAALAELEQLIGLPLR